MDLLLHLIPIPLALFWMWMLWDLAQCDDLMTGSPDTFAFPPESKFDWLVLFIIFNMFTAMYYFFTVFRQRSL